MKLDPRTDCPVLIVFGQSNAHGHGSRLPEAEQIHTPLKNVFTLSRAEHQAYGLTELHWTGFTTAGANLGETDIQDDACCLANYFAPQWQQRIDRGESLPNLYVIQISKSSQGVEEHDAERDGPNMLNMWWPERPKIIQHREDGSLDISLYPLALEILSLAADSIRAMGRRPVVIGLHWNQWETEVYCGLSTVLKTPAIYRAMWQGFRQALGTDYPLFLYQPLTEIYQDPPAQAAMTRFLETAARHPMVHMLDLRQSPYWEPDSQNHGIFQQDFVHYAPRSHKWFAQQQWKALNTME